MGRLQLCKSNPDSVPPSALMQSTTSTTIEVRVVIPSNPLVNHPHLFFHSRKKEKHIRRKECLKMIFHMNKTHGPSCDGLTSLGEPGIIGDSLHRGPQPSVSGPNQVGPEPSQSRTPTTLVLFLLLSHFLLPPLTPCPLPLPPHQRHPLPIF